MNVTFIKTFVPLWLGCVCRTNLVRGEGGLKWVEKGGREAERGGNMTSCPAGSVSSSLDSLEKLFSLQLSGKKKFWIFLLFWVHYYHHNVFCFFLFLLAPGPVSTSQIPPFNPLLYQIWQKKLPFKVCPNIFFLLTLLLLCQGLSWLLKLAIVETYCKEVIFQVCNMLTELSNCKIPNFS